jgi:hypothetical protein
MIWVVSLSSLKLIPQGLSPEIVTPVFGVWFSRVVWEDPQADSVSLPPVRENVDMFFIYLDKGKRCLMMPVWIRMIK